MENVELTFSDSLPVCELLDQFIPDDATCISVKVNVPDYDPSDNNFIPPALSSIKAYLEDCGLTILALSSGLHINGRREIPHIHYHFITNHTNGPSNPSQHRKRWLAKEDNSVHSFDDAQFKYQSLETNKPKYQFLAYPLKEGRRLLKRCYIYDGKQMNKEMIDFLQSVGNTIYQTQLALRQRQEKHQERKQLALRELFDLCSIKKFSSYSEMMIWLDEEYISKLDLEDMPDPKNYKTNSQKVAIKLGLLKYSQL